MLTLLGTGEKKIQETCLLFVFKEKKHENSYNPKFWTWVEKYVSCADTEEEESVGAWGMRQGCKFQLPTTFFPLDSPFSPQCLVLSYVSFILFFISYGFLMKENVFFSLIFQMRKETERLTNLPKITQLKNSRTRNQILPWSLQLTAHYFFSNKFCLRYRVLKVENVVFECLSFRQPRNNIHEDIFL